jgi:hypothetical protein
MNGITIYRVDGITKKDVPVGTVEERRKLERGDNLIGLMRVARKAFASMPNDECRFCIKLTGARIAF